MPPTSQDFTVELTTVGGASLTPVWTVSQNHMVRVSMTEEQMAVEMAIELAQLEHCDAWLLSLNGPPKLLGAFAILH